MELHKSDLNIFHTSYVTKFIHDFDHIMISDINVTYHEQKLQCHMMPKTPYWTGAS